MPPAGGIENAAVCQGGQAIGGRVRAVSFARAQMANELRLPEEGMLEEPVEFVMRIWPEQGSGKAFGAAASTRSKAAWSAISRTGARCSGPEQPPGGPQWHRAGPWA